MIPYCSMTDSFPSSVKTLNGINYEDWKDSLNHYLVINNFDLSLKTDKHVALTNASTDSYKALYEK